MYNNTFRVDWPSSSCEAERFERAREKQPNVLLYTQSFQKSKLAILQQPLFDYSANNSQSLMSFSNVSSTDFFSLVSLTSSFEFV